MNTKEFLAQLNDAEKDWGLWINRNNFDEYHVGHYSVENDRFPKSFVHVKNLDELAHLRQKYIIFHASSGKSEDMLGQDWADQFLSQWHGERSEC